MDTESETGNNVDQRDLAKSLVFGSHRFRIDAAGHQMDGQLMLGARSRELSDG